MFRFLFYINLLLSVFQAYTLQAQPYYFRKYQVENGLSNNATICSIQDKNGFLWFGTKDGLNRFDGYAFKIFRSDPANPFSLGSNFIHSLFEDRNGIVWIGTENGLYHYDALTERFSLLPGTAAGPVRNINMDQAGTLWFILGFTLYKYTVEKLLVEYQPGNYFEATSLCTLKDGSVWISTPAGQLKKYNSVDNTFSSFEVFEPSGKQGIRWIEKISATSEGSILVGTSNQGARIFNIRTSSSKALITFNPDKTEIFVRNFLQTSDNEIWIGTESGIFIYNLEKGLVTNLKKDYNDPYSISDNAVYSFCKDREGGIWTGTYFGGINYYPRQHTAFKKYFPKAGENSISGNVVREIHQDNDGNLWIGTEDAGLNKYDTASGKFTAFTPTGSKSNISYTNIHGMLVNGNELWIGTFEHGLDVLNMKTGKVVQHYSAGQGKNDLKSNFIYFITRTNDGEIFLGTTRGAYSYNKRTNDFSPVPFIPVNTWYTSILKDRRGTIWAGTYGTGLHFYNPVTSQNGNFMYEAANGNSLASNRVNSIFEDSDGNLWFATEGGLNKFTHGENGFKRYGIKEGFPSNFMLSILEDEKKNLWISTSKGLVCMDPQSGQLVVYTTVNGTLNNQFNFNSAYKDASGTMYFGSVKGMISFRPSAFVKNDFIPPVYITGFQVFNTELGISNNGSSPLTKSLIFTRKISLRYDQSTISIDFAALSFTAPEMSEYAYKMDALDKRWTSLKKNRKAYFTDLSPGKYVFRVKAANNSGLWNNRETTLEIEILPPWWAGKPAYLVYSLIVLLLTYLGIRYYHNMVNARNKRKFELLEIAKEKEIFAAKIDFFTKLAHEIKTPLTLIRAPLEKVIKKSENHPEISNYLKIMERNTNRLIDLTTQLLDFRQTEIQGFSLNFSRADIKELVEEAYTSFSLLAEKRNLVFKLEMPEGALIAYIDPDAFSKILFNLISNAVKYADKFVSIKLSGPGENDHVFTITVKNDGMLIPAGMGEKIFEPFFRLKQSEKQKGTGIGLALSLSLVQLHNGTLALKEPEDNLNVFVLKLPLNQENKYNQKPR